MQLLDRKQALSIPPVWRLGFRPFFLAGALFALLAVALWAAVLLGWASLAAVPGGMLAWHRHEMLFGFGLAIIAGFLLTAVQNWTGRPGLSGWRLITLFGVWLAARLAWFAPVPLVALIALQLAFIGLFIAQMAHQLIAARQRNNYPILLVLSLLALCQSLTLTGLAQGDDELQRRGTLAALWLIAVLLSLIGGRVIPFFTQRGLGRPEAFAAHPGWIACCWSAACWWRRCMPAVTACRPAHGRRCPSSSWRCCTACACGAGTCPVSGAYRCCGHCTWPTPGCWSPASA